MKKVTIKRIASCAFAALILAGSVPFANVSNVLNTSISASADTTTEETTNIRKSIKVKGMDENDTSTVTAYQIIKGTYRDGLVTGFECRSELGSLKINNLQEPNEDEITAIASAIRAGTVQIDGITMSKTSEPETAGTIDFTADVEPGLYLVLVSNSKDGYLYNPAVVAVNVKDASGDPNSVEGGVVDLNSYFKFPANAYLKSNKVSVDKVIVEEDGTTADGTSAAVGDKVHFRIDKMVIPSYSKQYKSPTYTITDELENASFTDINDITVKINNVVTKSGADTFLLVGKDGSGVDVVPIEKDGSYSFPNCKAFKIDFTEEFLLANEGKSVVVDYYSVISNTAGFNFSENQNTATIEYTNGPDSTTTVKDTSYHYTFGISAAIDAEDTTESGGGQTKKKVITNEINKVSSESSEYEEIIDEEGNVIMKNKYALSGAEFTLYKSFERTEQNKVASCVSNEYGAVSFTGLNAGTYYLAETKAPKGYSIKATVYRIEINPTFDEIGVMTAYSINTYVAGANGEKGEAVQSATYTNTNYIVNPDGSVTNEIVIVNDVYNPVAIVNTTLAILPSTGGAGTIMLTVGASIGMAIFLTIHIASKRKKREQ